jgi:hypothetical protein
MIKFDCKVDFKSNSKKTFQDLKKNKDLKVFVGVLQKNNSSRDDEKTNAEIGYDHEFGTKKIPQRSFLRLPINTELDKIKKIVQGFVKNQLTKKVFDLKEILGKVGFVATNVIRDAFDNAGFGKWQKLSKTTIEKKGHEEILKDKLQLLRSVDFEVKK